MIGENVTVIGSTTTGTDRYGDPVSTPTETSVSDVLVTPGATADLDATRPEGTSVVFTLHFPKTFDAPLKGRKVRLDDRVTADDTATYAVVGDPKHYTLGNTPTRWWMPVEVEAVNG